LPLSTTPPWAAEARVPTSIIPSAIGSTALRKTLSAWPIRVLSAAGSGWLATVPIWTNSCRTVAKARLTSMGSSTLAAAAPSQVPSSWVRGIWPSLRAFFSRCGVGFSVFSPPGPSLAISRSSARSSPGRRCA
jgi:hypothetical protein